MARRNYHGAQFNQSPTIIEKAGANIDDCRNRIMKYDENGDVVLATAGTDMPIGIALIEAGYNDISGVTAGMVQTGEAVDILVKDMGVAIAGEAIKKGQEVAAGADGLAAVAVSGDYVLGIALETVEADNYFRIQLAKYMKTGATGSGEQMTEEEDTQE